MTPRFLSCFAREVTAKREVLKSRIEDGKGDAGQFTFNMQFRGGIAHDVKGTLTHHLVIVDAKFAVASPSFQDHSLLKVDVIFQCRFHIDRPLDDAMAKDLDFVKAMHEVAEPIVRRFTQQLLTSMDIGTVLRAIPPVVDGVVTSQSVADTGEQLL